MALVPPVDQDIIVLGASGDLAARKLIPALYNLSEEGLLPPRGRIIGGAPMDWDTATFVDHAKKAVTDFSRTGIDASAWDTFASRLAFVNLKDGYDKLLAACQTDRRIVYLAVPASAFAGIIGQLKDAGMAEGTSIIIEKPFGHNHQSAVDLNKALHAVFEEDHIFRIDHYMGKETVQNMLVFRFGNSLFERLWNRDAVESVEITVAEELGVELRGAFYEETGAIRDILQNHLFQVLAVFAMEPPASFEAEAIRNEKIKVFKATRPLKVDDVVRGQYQAGAIAGEKVDGYMEEPGVAQGSVTETFVAAKLEIDTWRWSGVPFFLRTGKRMPVRDTRVVIRFREVPLHLFADSPGPDPEHNLMVIRIQPDEGISMRFVAKEPGPELTTQQVRMEFSYGTSFKKSPPEAYERLLHDALCADHTLFIREDEVEQCWVIVEPILETPPPLHYYAAGSWGPVESDKLVGGSGWHDPGENA